MVELTDGNGAGYIGTTDSPEFRAAEAEFRALETSILLARSQFFRQAGSTFDGARDTYGILGYQRQLTTREYRDRYARGGLAGRIVDVMPDATWRGEPAMELVEDEDPQTDTEFEKVWRNLDTKHQICSKLQRVDKLSRLSTYAVLLIGASGNFDEELPKGMPDGLLYLMPFSGGGGPDNSGGVRIVAMDAACQIAEYEIDATNPRFGLPKSYYLKRTDITSPMLARPVHWTRIIHVAEGLLEDEVFGQPALERVWNLLDDLDKITGGGAESFWLRANQGMHIDVDKDMALTDAKNTMENLKVQAEAYKHQLDRWIRTKGVKVETLGSDVANFANPADAVITQIAGAKSIPKRILTGSEMGELASSQDRENFRDQVNGRQAQYCGPYMVRVLADRLIKYGYLLTPKKGPAEYKVVWPHIQTMTEDEKVKGAQGWASVNQTQGEVVFTDAEIRDKWAGYEPLTDEQRQEIDDRAAEKVKQAQEAMAAAAPAEDEKKVVRAAEDAEDIELLKVLEAAIIADNQEVIAQIIGVTHRALGGPGSGNFGHSGRPGEIGGSTTAGKTSAERQHAGLINKAEERIADLLQSGDTFHTQRNADGTWKAERVALHERIVSDALKGKPAGLDQPTAILMSGLPAAGKSSLVEGIDQTAFVVVNADTFKEQLPEYNGENAAILHEESAYLADVLFHTARERKQNIILDGTLKTSGDMKDGGALGKAYGLKNAGYRVEARFVDVDVNHAVERAVLRYAKKELASGNGRYVPASFIRSMGDKPLRSYEALVSSGLLDAWMKVDNRGKAPRIVERGGTE